MTLPPGPARPVPHRRGDQPLIASSPGNAIRLVLPGRLAQAEFGLFEGSTEPGHDGATPHYHRTFTETFYILSGTLSVLAGDRWETVGGGDVLHVPRLGVHAFRNDADETARYLILFTPGIDRERYFAEIAALHRRDRPPTTAEIDEVAARHDQFNQR